MIENLIVAMIVLAAVWWLSARVYRTVIAATSGNGKGVTSCGSCGGCSKASAKKSDGAMVTISGPVNKNR